MSNSRPGPGPMGRGGGGRNAMPHGQKAKNIKGTTMRLLGYLSAHIYKIIAICFLIIFTTILTTYATRLIGVCIDRYIVEGDLQNLTRICATMIIIYLSVSLFTWLQNIVMLNIAQETVSKIRADLFNKLQSLPLKYFDSRPNGEIMSRVTNDVDNISTTLNQSITQIMSSVFTLIFTFIAMLLLSPLLTLVSMLVIPVMLIITKLITKRSRVHFAAKQKKLGKLNGFIEEIISGQKVVKVFNREEDEIEAFQEINKSLLDSSVKAEIYSGALGPIAGALNNINYGVIAVIGGIMIISGMNMTVGIITSFITYSRQFTRPLTEIANLANIIISALAGAERVFEVIDEEPEPGDKEDAKELTALDGIVSLKEVDFQYVDDNPVLKNVNLYAQAGQTIALVGPTGAGKTTIINLLTRFYDVQKGAIQIDGYDIRDIKRNNLRSMLGIVLQDTYLFTGTIEENLKYGKLDATHEEVKEAAKLANAHEFIKRLPEGYNTVLTDGGSNLSQGQRQMLSIARVILSDPEILILDEATSSVDTRTEVKIQEAMKNLMKGRTNFVIAHRLSTIKDADLIAVINHGEIIERGTHDSLIEKEGFYYNLYMSQFAEVSA